MRAHRAAGGAATTAEPRQTFEEPAGPSRSPVPHCTREVPASRSPRGAALPRGWRSRGRLLGNQARRRMILPELLFELSLSPAADPLHLETDVRRVPVLIGVSALGLTHDLPRIEAPRGNRHRLCGHD